MFPSNLIVTYIFTSGIKLNKLYYPIKMERLKVKELKALSKSLGLRGYSRLNKADLGKLIMDHLASGPRRVPRP